MFLTQSGHGVGLKAAVGKPSTSVLIGLVLRTLFLSHIHVISLSSKRLWLRLYAVIAMFCCNQNSSVTQDPNPHTLLIEQDALRRYKLSGRMEHPGIVKLIIPALLLVLG